jgi:hypothetical protein
MKAASVSGDIAAKLASLLEDLKIQSKRMLTYQDVVETMIRQSVVLPEELIGQVRKFVGKNRQLGFANKEEFISNAIRFRLNWLKTKNKILEISGENYEKLNEAIRQMNAPFQDAEDYINSMIIETLRKYEEKTELSE